MLNACKRFSSVLAISISIFILAGCGSAPTAPAAPAASAGQTGQTTLQTITFPQGGKIVYGLVAGQTTEAAAMGAVLRALHSQYGDKPQVGKVFQVRGTNSYAVFFTLVKRNGGNGQVAGMMIASKFAPNRVEAAVMSDDAARFGSTINPMLTELFKVWHPAGAGSASGTAQGSAPAPAGAGAPAAALHPFTLKDHSASVSLPDGWNVSPASGMGTIMASGPNGEAIAMNYAYLAMDTRNPRVRQTEQWATQGAGRNSSYARSLYFPAGGDLGKTFADLNAMELKRAGMPAPSVQITNEKPMQVAARMRCALLSGKIDPQDGKGPKELSTVFCQGPTSPMGQFMNVAYHTAVPIQLADKERATMSAILASFSENTQVTRAQANAIAAPAIAAIKAEGERAKMQADAAHAANDAHNQAVEQRWDAQDKNNQGFSNYLLDQTVIKDNENNGHATVWNKTADLLVSSNPDRFEYVNTPNYWKGIDY